MRPIDLKKNIARLGCKRAAYVSAARGLNLTPINLGHNNTHLLPIAHQTYNYTVQSDAILRQKVNYPRDPKCAKISFVFLHRPFVNRKHARLHALVRAKINILNGERPVRTYHAQGGYPSASTAHVVESDLRQSQSPRPNRIFKSTYRLLGKRFATNK